MPLESMNDTSVRSTTTDAELCIADRSARSREGE
jgi:hypothetical protein